MSEKLLLELYERIATLEEKVAALEKAAESSRLTDKPKGEIVGEVKGKYRYFSDYLLNSGASVIDLTFGEIEKIIQDELPPSCRKHRALWANTDTHAIARAWMNVGYRTTDVQMKREIVRFEKTRIAK